MLKYLIGSILIANIISCVNTPTRCFPDISCIEGECTQYDYEKVTMTNSETGKVVKDTLIDRTQKTCNIFKPCRAYIFRAIYKSSDDVLISSNLIRLFVTGRRWRHQPEKQDEVLMQFQFEKSDIENSNKHIVNKRFSPLRFTKLDTTGVIENVKEVWMHPFRSNQYNFTEVAPFPSVKLPLHEGKTWTSSLHIGNGWGDWQGTVISNAYEVMGKKELELPFKGSLTCWKVKASSTADFGTSTLEFYFNSVYGFVRMEYKNYLGQSLVFDLVEVVDG
jgi:hypothetical protein